MLNAEHREKLRKWKLLKAYYREPVEKPLTLDGGVAVCVCDALPPHDWVRMLFRSVIVGLAFYISLSPVKKWLLRLIGMRIGKGVFISPGVVIDPLFPALITLEDHVLLGMGSRLLTHEYTATNFRVGRIVIGKGSVIGAWALVRSGVTIGENVTVGACSFVNRDVPPNTTVVGVPAREVKARTEEPVCNCSE